MKDYLIKHKDIFKKTLFWADKEIDYVFASSSIWKYSTKKLSDSQNIIDLGCGPGTLLSNISQKASGEVIGIDLSKEKLIYASKMAPKSNVIKADVLNLPFPEKTFDMVYSSQLIEHVDDDKMIGETNRVLKDKGLFILGTVFRKGSLYPQNVEHLREYTSEKQLAEPLNKHGSLVLHSEINPVKYSALDRLFRLMYHLSPSNNLIELPKHKVFFFLRKHTQTRIPTFYHLEIIAQKN